MLIAMLLAAGTPLYLGPLTDRFSGEPCPMPIRGKVDDGTIEYSAEVLGHTRPNIMGRCHERRIAIYEATKVRRSGGHQRVPRG